MKKSTIIIVILLSNTLCLLAQSSFTSNNIPLSLSNPTKERQEFEFRSNSSSSFDFLDIFDEVEQFEEESLIFQLGSGFVRDVALEQPGIKTVLPPVVLSIEKAYWKNIGLGLKAGFRWWKIPKIDLHYRYYSLSFRAAYHLNILDNLDPYIGIATTARFITFTGSKPPENNFDYDIASLIIGARYYFSEKWAFYLERSPDGQSNFHAGFALKLQ